MRQNEVDRKSPASAKFGRLSAWVSLGKMRQRMAWQRCRACDERPSGCTRGLKPTLLGWLSVHFENRDLDLELGTFLFSMVWVVWHDPPCQMRQSKVTRKRETAQTSLDVRKLSQSVKGIAKSTAISAGDSDS